MYKHLNQCRTFMFESRRQGRFQILRSLHTGSVNTCRLGQPCEIRIDQFRAVVKQPSRLHFQLYETERVVIENDQLHRQVELSEREQIPEQHGQPTISGKCNDLPVWMAGLHPNGLGKSVRHGAVIKGAEQPALSVHGEIACSPNRRCTHIAGEYRILSGKLIQSRRNVLRVNRRSARVGNGEVIEALARFTIVAQAFVKEGLVRFSLKQRYECVERVFHISDQAQIDWGSPSNLFAKPIYLNDLRVLWIKLLVREIRSQHQQRITVHHCVIARREAKQAGHSNIKRVVILDELLAPQRMNDWRLQQVCNHEKFRVSAATARAPEDGHFNCLVQDVCSFEEFRWRWDHH